MAKPVVKSGRGVSVGASKAAGDDTGLESSLVVLDIDRVMASYLPGGVRLLPLIYAREASTHGVRINLPHKHSLDRLYIDYSIADKLYREALAVAGKRLGIDKCERDYACASMALDYIARVITGQESASEAYDRIVSYKNFKNNIVRDVADGYMPVIVFMAPNKRSLTVMLQLHLVRLIYDNILKWTAKRLDRDGNQDVWLEPCVTLLLWPQRDPDESIVLEPEVKRLFKDRYTIIMMDPNRYSGDWLLYDFVAEAHSIYFSRGATAPHNALTNTVLEDSWGYISDQRRGYTLAYALAELIGFPYTYAMPELGDEGKFVDADRGCVSKASKDRWKPAYIVISSLAQYTTIRLMLEALVLAHKGLSERLGLGLHSSLSNIAGSIKGWKEVRDYSFRSYLIEFKRIIPIWESIYELKSIAYDALSGGASSKRKRPRRITHDPNARREFEEAAREAYMQLSSRDLEVYITAAKRLVLDLPDPEDGAVVIPLVLRSIAEALKDRVTNTINIILKSSKELEESIDIISCRNIIDGFSMLYDILALYMLSYPQFMFKIKKDLRFGEGIPKEIVMPTLGFDEYKKALFRDCRSALIELLSNSRFLDNYSKLTGILAEAALTQKLKEDIAYHDINNLIKAIFDIVSDLSGALYRYFPGDIADSEAKHFSGVLSKRLAEVLRNI